MRGVGLSGNYSLEISDIIHSGSSCCSGCVESLCEDWRNAKVKEAVGRKTLDLWEGFQQLCPAEFTHFGDKQPHLEDLI